MSASSLLLPELLIRRLRDLCALPTDSTRPDDLSTAAERLSTILHQIGMQVWKTEAGSAPLLIARRAGRSARTLLLYHHYDTAPAGPWRAWSHAPFALVERDGALYARGVVDGKGPLVAHLHALDLLIRTNGELPCGIVLVIEGAAHQGSPGLSSALAGYSAELAADGVLGSAGERTQADLPLCYSGSKGLLQVRLSVRGAANPVETGFAPTIRNPLWRLIWALGQIKGEDEDIRIPGFYDHVDGPTREENAALRQIAFSEPDRLAAWGSNEFLFGMSGVALVRAETTLPTCNVSALVCDPLLDHAVIPAAASARLDFALVPQQTPEQIFQCLQRQLQDSNFTDVHLDLLPGGYPPARTTADAPFVQLIAAAGAALYGQPLPIVPAGSFSLPLQLLTAINHAPIASVGLRRPSSGVLGPNEHVPIGDLLRHSQLLSDLLKRMAV